MAEKLEKVTLPYPVTINGVTYEGEVEVSKEIKVGLDEVVAANEEYKATVEKNLEDATPAEEK